MEEITERLLRCNAALEYAAFNYDGSKLEDLPDNMIESTGVSDTCLIEVRENLKFLEAWKK